MLTCRQNHKKLLGINQDIKMFGVFFPEGGVRDVSADVEVSSRFFRALDTPPYPVAE